MSRPILVTGAGGVGKTTISAALAVRAAQAGYETLVLTVDPAKRLANALGVDELNNTPTPNPTLSTLWAAMLDSEAGWDEIARTHAPPDAADRLLNSEFFRTISRHFPASQSYAAADAMARFLDERRWDLVIVDTPPASGGIEFFTSPNDLKNLIGGRLFRWLTGGPIPGRKELFNVAARPALRVVDIALGSDLLERVAAFLFDLRTTYDGLSARAKEIERYFKKATIVVVSTSDPAPVTEAARFFRELPTVANQPATVVFNRTLPEVWDESPIGSSVSRPLARNLALWGREAHRQETVRDEFAARYRTSLVTIPWQPTAPTDLDSLSSLVAETGLDGLLA